MSMPRAAILAGGLGTRIRDVAGDLPKVLLPVEGKPFVAHLLRDLRDQGVTQVVLCLGHLAETVWKSACDHAPEGLDLVDSREDSPLGTAGALKHAGKKLGDPFFVVNGDTYLEVSLARLLELHSRHQALITLSLVSSDRAGEKGSVRVDDTGRVVAFEEKTAQGTGLINGGVYVAGAGILDGCLPDTVCSLERELIPRAIQEGRTLMGHVTGGRFVDIGLPDDYLSVRDALPRSPEDA